MGLKAGNSLHRLGADLAVEQEDAALRGPAREEFRVLAEKLAQEELGELVAGAVLVGAVAGAECTHGHEVFIHAPLLPSGRVKQLDPDHDPPPDSCVGMSAKAVHPAERSTLPAAIVPGECLPHSVNC